MLRITFVGEYFLIASGSLADQSVDQNRRYASTQSEGQLQVVERAETEIVMNVEGRPLFGNDKNAVLSILICLGVFTV